MDPICQMKCLQPSCILDCPMLLDDHCLWDLPGYTDHSLWVPVCLTGLPAMSCIASLMSASPQLQISATPTLITQLHSAFSGPLCDKIWQLYGLKLFHWDYSLRSQTMNHDSPKLQAQTFQQEGMLENAFSCQMRFCKCENIL